ncbi:hypothetical protein GGI04_005095 [Coemansia thaxteri]|nr:hypothetical protein GGI04_005095 [Coemansia thaxteri]
MLGLALKGAAVATGVGLVGVLTYYVSTYFYLREHWPVSSDIADAATRNLLYMATYYEQVAPNHDKALRVLEKVLHRMVVQKTASSDSIAVLDVKLRIAECLQCLGQEEEAARLSYLLLPSLQALANSSSTSSINRETNTMAGPGTLSADALLARLAMTLGQACAAVNSNDEAKRACSIGLQAVKRMKSSLARSFDGEDLASYTAYDGVNLKEAELTAQLAKVFYKAGEPQVAETLFQGVLRAVKQHRAQLDLAPRVISDMRTFKDGWICLDALAMLYLAKMLIDSKNTSAALPWIESARKIASDRVCFERPRCIDCEASLIAQLGRIAESQGDLQKALRRYREASEYARVYFSDLHSGLLAEAERLES